jgi:hypothetical protein
VADASSTESWVRHWARRNQRGLTMAMGRQGQRNGGGTMALDGRERPLVVGGGRRRFHRRGECCGGGDDLR